MEEGRAKTEYFSYRISVPTLGSIERQSIGRLPTRVYNASFGSSRPQTRPDPGRRYIWNVKRTTSVAQEVSLHLSNFLTSQPS